MVHGVNLQIFMKSAGILEKCLVIFINIIVSNNKNIQNGGNKQCEGYVTLKEKLS